MADNEQRRDVSAADNLRFTIMRGGEFYHTDKETAELQRHIMHWDHQTGGEAMTEALFQQGVQAGRIQPGMVQREDAEHAYRPQLDLGDPQRIQYGATSEEVERGIGPAMARALTDRSRAYEVNPEAYEAVPAPTMAPALTDRTSAREVVQQMAVRATRATRHGHGNGY